MKKSLGNIQYRKKKVRATKEWRQLRVDIKSEHNNTDPITLRPLRLGFNVHHKDDSVENYDKLDDHSKFVPLNKATHELIHTIFTYYKKDPAILDRIKALLDEMLKYS